MTETNQKTCGTHTGFDYCFWAKLLVAIPTLPFVGIMAAAQFESEMGRGLAAAVAVIAVVLLARWVDRVPAFQKMIHIKRTDR